MTAQTRTYIDLVCDYDGCDNELSEFSEQGYPDEHDAREAAVDYDWQITEHGDFCPDHPISAILYEGSRAA